MKTPLSTPQELATEVIFRGYQQKQAGWIQMYDPRIHEKGGKENLGFNTNA